MPSISVKRVETQKRSDQLILNLRSRAAPSVANRLDYWWSVAISGALFMFFFSALDNYQDHRTEVLMRLVVSLSKRYLAVAKRHTSLALVLYHNSP